MVRIAFYFLLYLYLRNLQEYLRSPVPSMSLMSLLDSVMMSLYVHDYGDWPSLISFKLKADQAVGNYWISAYIHSFLLY